MDMPYQWPALLRTLASISTQYRSLRIRDVASGSALDGSVVLRLDVERRPQHALRLAEQISQLGMTGSFYFHTRRGCYDPSIMRQIEALGMEVGLHHECLDRCRGDFWLAHQLFLAEVARFRDDGLSITTVCAHGENGLVRNGYRGNGDLFSRYPRLLADAGLLGEAYMIIHGRQFASASDTFRSYGGFFQCVNSHGDGFAKHILVHPHRWHVEFAASAVEVARDSAQYFSNRVLKGRSYQTILPSPRSSRPS